MNTDTVTTTTATGEIRTLELVPSPFAGIMQTATPIRVRLMKRNGEWARTTRTMPLLVANGAIYAMGYGTGELEIL